MDARKRFLFCEDQEGGMAVSEMDAMSARQYALAGIDDTLRRRVSTQSDHDLLDWLSDADVGDYLDYRLGVWVRLKDK